MDWLSQNWVYLLLLLGVVFFMARGGMGCGMSSHRGHAHREGGGQDDARARTSATDPVSGRPVDERAAVATVYQGSNYYFESRENRDRFEAAPEKYAKQAADGHGQHGHRHGGGCC
jgi:YHS domain-containing protein